MQGDLGAVSALPQAACVTPGKSLSPGGAGGTSPSCRQALWISTLKVGKCSFLAGIGAL